MFSGDPLKENIWRGFDATKQAFVFGIVDNMIYGNWLYSVVTSIFLPNWVCFWCVAFCRQQSEDLVENIEEKKTN